ncbi:MAG TPA: hypothetical protein PLN91_01000 [Rhodanobacteraceae bacterium]|nr:hypothetical protein [Rhodanobacteraceae bacterium]
MRTASLSVCLGTLVAAAATAAHAATAASGVVIVLSNPSTGQSVTITTDHVEIRPDGRWVVDCNAPNSCMTPSGPLGAAQTALQGEAARKGAATAPNTGGDSIGDRHERQGK